MKRVKEEMVKRADRLNALLQGSGVRVEYVEKNHGNQLIDAYMVKYNDSKVIPSVSYAPRWYDLPDEEVAAYLEELGKKEVSVDLDKYMDPEYVRSHVYPLMIGASCREQVERGNFLYRLRDDFLIMYYVEVKIQNRPGPDNLEDAMLKLTHPVFRMTGLSEEELHTQAFENMDRQTEVILLSDALRGIFEPDTDTQVLPVYVVTGRDRGYGAAGILCSSAYSQLSAAFGEKFVVLPSSLHECLAVSLADVEDPLFYTMMVQEVNHEAVREEEWLADHAYIYDGRNMTRIE